MAPRRNRQSSLPCRPMILLLNLLLCCALPLMTQSWMFVLPLLPQQQQQQQPKVTTTTVDSSERQQQRQSSSIDLSRTSKLSTSPMVPTQLNSALSLLLAQDVSPPSTSSSSSLLSTFASKEEIVSVIKTNPKTIILDLRTQKEIEINGKIQTTTGKWYQSDCTRMECPSLVSTASKMFPDKKAPIIVHCASGVRASKAKEVLEGQGYQLVLNAGGFEALQEMLH